MGLPAVLALPLRIIEVANPEWRLLNFYFMGQAILITALVIDYAGGKVWLRYFIFPLLFPIIAVPWPSGIEQDIVQLLQRAVVRIGVEGASWMGWSAFQRGNLIILSHGIVGVNDACSGIRSLQSSLMIALFLGGYFQLTIPRRCALVMLALMVAFGLNVLRACLLIAVMNLHGGDAMLQLHDPAGLGIAFLSLWVLWFATHLLADHRAAVPGSVRAWKGTRCLPAHRCITLLIAWGGAELLTEAWYQGHERHFRAEPTWTLRWPPPCSNFKQEDIDETVRSYLRYNQGWHGEWTDQFHWDLFFFIWKPGRVAAGLAQSHHPDICLPAAGYVLKSDFGVESMDSNGVVLPVRRYIFQDPASSRLLYVFQVVTDDRSSGPAGGEEKHVPDSWERLQAAWAGRRNQGQRSLLVVNQGAANLAQAENGLRKMLAGAVLLTP